MSRRTGESAKGELAATLTIGEVTEQCGTIIEGETCFPQIDSRPKDKVTGATVGIEYLREVRDKVASSTPEIPDKSVLGYSVTFYFFQSS
jgi:hypothetical protein